MKNSTVNFENATREEMLAVLVALNGQDFSATIYKGKRVATLIGIAIDMIEANKTEVKTVLSGDLAKFIVEEPKKASKLLISEMSPEEIMKNLTPKQAIVLDDMIASYDKLHNFVHGSSFIPEKSPFAVGGVITTLIEKGIVVKGEKPKSFTITEPFQNIIK